MTSITHGIINGYRMHWFASQNVFYFILDVIFTEFTYTPIFLLDYIRYEGLLGFWFILFLFRFYTFKRGYIYGLIFMCFAIIFILFNFVINKFDCLSCFCSTFLWIWRISKVLFFTWDNFLHVAWTAFLGVCLFQPFHSFDC